ncbi:E3 SUMO-protein ligase NSE2-like [Melanaphis sacchari]|uniref:E3 SUMO-protein ligase NSE2-like n=1 Tax=Melanaphis sacchari TaxID=742174 RepID=UPI000DC1311E|nr:E3 SUMO-protein ligase NSE2-like [Melanaphis sacchari]XP_025199628.1 E3 SUMO-protein ligase NSE2-like [Melanaphis sacchari]
MTSNETEDENRRNLNYDDLDVYGKLEVKLAARNKITCHKDINLPCALVEDTDLSDILDNIPSVRPNKHLEDNAQTVSSLIDNIRQVKRTSELEMNFTINEEKDEDDEISQAITQIRQQSEKLIKRIIHAQVDFNEFLSSTDSPENREYLKDHLKIIEKTCKFDRGIESVIRCNKDTLEKHIDKSLKIENIEEFKNAYNELAQGIISTIYDSGVKTSKNHEHLLAIKQYNKCTQGGLVGEDLVIKTLDPFTKQPITKPVRNKICTHIYDQESINKMFLNKQFISCPYMGCSNKHFTKANLDLSMISD